MKTLALTVFVVGAALLASDTQADNAFVCSEAPSPIVALSYESRYASGDRRRVIIDPAREAEAEAALAPLDSFIDSLSGATERLYEGSPSSRQASADCIVDQLADWARADALSELSTETVRLTIGSRYAAFALILWQASAYARGVSEIELVTDWLSRRMDEQITFWREAPDGASRSNLRAWTGLAAAALAVQTGRADHLTWAEESSRIVICSALPDGSLPQEMSRGTRALHYQLHAVAPLVSTTLLLRREGIEIDNECNEALHRIVDFTVSNLMDGARVEAITGYEQTLFQDDGAIGAFQLAWIEPYLLLRSSETLEALRDQLRPMIYTKLGGNQTALWAD